MKNDIRTYLKSNYYILFGYAALLYSVIMSMIIGGDSDLTMGTTIFILLLFVAVPIYLAFRIRKIVKTEGDEVLIENFKFLSNIHLLIIILMLPFFFGIIPIIAIINHSIAISKIKKLIKSKSN